MLKYKHLNTTVYDSMSVDDFKAIKIYIIIIFYWYSNQLYIYKGNYKMK